MKLQFQILSDFGYLPFLTRLFKKLKAKEPARLTQILVEAFNNAVAHAHHFEKRKWIGVMISLSKKKAVLRVIDQGGGIQKTLKEPEGWQTRGRGLALIRRLASKTKIYKKGKHHILEATRIYE